MTKLSREYVEFAKRDLMLVDDILKNYSDDMLVNLAAYHCQQALEKCIKSVYIENRIELWKTHDIHMLLDRLRGKDIDISVFSQIAQDEALITHWEDKARYTAGLLSSKHTISHIRELIGQIIVRLESAGRVSETDIESLCKSRGEDVKNQRGGNN